jgi:hypothetical protein
MADSGRDPLPAVNELIEVSILGGESHRSRVEDVDGDTVTVAAPLNLKVEDLPGIGDLVTIRWSAGARGRYAAPARIVEFVRGGVPRWITRPTGTVVVEQSRQFVRGGGGEPVVLLRQGQDDTSPVQGHVADLSEGGLRARFTDLEGAVGDTVVVTLTLDGETIDATGQIHRTTRDHGEPGVQVVVVLDLPERQAQLVRRYVMKHQLAARRVVRA